MLVDLCLSTTRKNVCTGSCLLQESVLNMDLDSVLEKDSCILFPIVLLLFQQLNTR